MRTIRSIPFEIKYKIIILHITIHLFILSYTYITYQIYETALIYYSLCNNKNYIRALNISTLIKYDFIS